MHYSTDTNLLFDALRKVITLSARASKDWNLLGWGKSGYNLRQVKRLLRRTQKVKTSTSLDEKKKAKRERERKKAYCKYLKQAQVLVQRGQETLLILSKDDEGSPFSVAVELVRFLNHARRQIDQIERRVLWGESVLPVRTPHRVDQQGQSGRAGRVGTQYLYFGRSIWVHSASSNHGRANR